MLLVKAIQLLLGIVFTYFGFELRIRHNDRVLRGFSKHNYSGNGRGYARRVGRIYLFGGLFNLICSLVSFIFLRIDSAAEIGTKHYAVLILFALGAAGMLLAVLVNELYTLRRYVER